MSHAAILRAAKEVIADDSRWLQMGFAADERGNPVEPVCDRARYWCGVGAVLAAGDTDICDAQELIVVFDYLARAAKPDELCEDVDDMICVVADVNDRSGYKDRDPKLAFKAVHAMYDRAIEMAEAA